MTNGFKIIGISTRTTNKDNQSKEDLGKLWERFFSEKIIEKVPNKLFQFTQTIKVILQTNTRQL